jgi:hypothetical protein
MIRIGFITDHWGESPALSALQGICSAEGFNLETIEGFRDIESVPQAIWGLLNLVDIVVAYITKDSKNIYYEIGLAHGIGKPVIILAEEFLSLPADLIGQRTLTIDAKKSTSENLAFRIEEAIDEAKRAHSFTGYRGPREDTGNYPPSRLDILTSSSFRALFSFEGAARGIRFEKWFTEVAGAVPGWEVIASERKSRHKDGFDLVIWNSRKDFELNALGNPIAVEIKSIRAMNSVVLEQFLYRAQISGLKTVVLATTGINDPRAKKLFARTRREKGFNAIALDRDDLIQISRPEDMLDLFKRKIRELLYEGEK